MARIDGETYAVDPAAPRSFAGKDDRGFGKLPHDLEGVRALRLRAAANLQGLLGWDVLGRTAWVLDVQHREFYFPEGLPGEAPGVAAQLRYVEPPIAVRTESAGDLPARVCGVVSTSLPCTCVPRTLVAGLPVVGVRAVFHPLWKQFVELKCYRLSVRVGSHPVELDAAVLPGKLRRTLALKPEDWVFGLDLLRWGVVTYRPGDGPAAIDFNVHAIPPRRPLE